MASCSPIPPKIHCHGGASRVSRTTAQTTSLGPHQAVCKRPRRAATWSGTAIVDEQLMGGIPGKEHSNWLDPSVVSPGFSNPREFRHKPLHATHPHHKFATLSHHSLLRSDAEAVCLIPTQHGVRNMVRLQTGREYAMHTGFPSCRP